MKMKIFMLTASVLFLFLAGCQYELTEVEYGEIEKTLRLKVSAENMSNSSVSKSSFEYGDKIGLFFSSGSPATAYNTAYENTLYEFGPAGWNADRNVHLTATQVDIHAYYPYREEAKRVGNDIIVPIDCSTGYDYMWGKMISEPGYVDNNNLHVTVRMYHALAKVQFKFVKLTYADKGVVTSLGIQDTGPFETSFIRGNMSLSTGEIEKTERTTFREVLKEPYVIPDTNTSEDDYPAILSIPTEDGLDHDVSFVATIDGQRKQVYVMHGWEAGKKYIYTILLHGNKMYVGDVEVIDWIDTPNDSATIRY